MKYRDIIYNEEIIKAINKGIKKGLVDINNGLLYVLKAEDMLMPGVIDELKEMIKKESDPIICSSKDIKLKKVGGNEKNRTKSFGNKIEKGVI